MFVAIEIIPVQTNLKDSFSLNPFYHDVVENTLRAGSGLSGHTENGPKGTAAVN